MSYTELHSRSAFSFLRGGSRPEELAGVAAKLELSTVALCDRDGVYGAPIFSGEAKEKGIRPIIGAEITLEDESVLPVLVENRSGYRNLCRLLTRAHLRTEKGKPRVRWDELPEFAEGLVALTGDEEGPLARVISRSADFQSAVSPIFNRQAVTDSNVRPHARHSQVANLRYSRLKICATDVLEKLIRAFGSQNVFVEIQRHHRRGEERLNKALVELAEQFHLPLLATNGVLYATSAGRQVLDVFTCIRHHTHLDAAGLLLEQNSERHLKTPAQMHELFRDLPEAIANTTRLAERLQFSLDNLGYEFPKYRVPDGHSMDSFLRERAFAGAVKRYGCVPEKVRRQMNDELALIAKLGVAGYFLIVWDIVEFCREQNIMCQGRGSAANSTVCFCLGITAVDPLKFNTLFERFLSEGRRNHWPDIDIDLPSGDRRERVIQEVYRRYGKNGAAMTANVITYRGRSAAREIGKTLNLGTDILDRFSALFANGDFPHTMDLSVQMQQSGLPHEHPRAAAFVTLYQQMHGLPRHLGQHSGGMIVCEGQLDSVMPLENASMPGRVVAQWDKDDCENMGIIKVDLLGLGMMSVLQDAVELTRQRGHPVDLANIPQDDARTYDMMCEADTVGVFQIESRAQMATLPRMKPRRFYDVCIEVAIIRPGPIQGNLTHPFLKRRAGKEAVTYYDPSLEPILKPILERTLGVPLFQEQMLEMAMRLADFNGSEAEELRRALSFHRSDKQMQKVSGKLRAAMEAKGHKPHVIQGVMEAITSFALYGFPESHAISFAHMAYSSAYLKGHYAPEFCASLLNNQPMGFYSSATLIKDAQRHGVHFKPVCVLRSEWDCVIESSADFQSAVSPIFHRQDAESSNALEVRDALVSLSPQQGEELRVRGGSVEEPCTLLDASTVLTPHPGLLPVAGRGRTLRRPQESIRLGLRVVRGLNETSARQLLEERARASFTSLEDLKRRVRLNKDELRTLAEIGALNCFAAHRREAMWEVEREIRVDDLFDIAEQAQAEEQKQTRESEKLSPAHFPPCSLSPLAEKPRTLAGRGVPAAPGDAGENRDDGWQRERRAERISSKASHLCADFSGLVSPPHEPGEDFGQNHPSSPTLLPVEGRREKQAERLPGSWVQSANHDSENSHLSPLPEGEGATQLVDQKIRVPGQQDKLAPILPLPKGEGRGEGEENDELATIHPIHFPLRLRQSEDSAPHLAAPLPPMNPLERLRADFAGTHLTVGRHPMAHVRSQLKDVWRASDLPKAKHGDYLRIAGNVICRQRPGTAKGFVFISLEDETGISNAIVRPDLFEELRLVITEESFLVIEGRLQNVDNVIHVRAEKIERLKHQQLVGGASHDFH